MAGVARIIKYNFVRCSKTDVRIVTKTHISIFWLKNRNRNEIQSVQESEYQGLAEEEVVNIRSLDKHSDNIWQILHLSIHARRRQL